MVPDKIASELMESSPYWNSCNDESISMNTNIVSESSDNIQLNSNETNLIDSNNLKKDEHNQELLEKNDNETCQLHQSEKKQLNPTQPTNQIDSDFDNNLKEQTKRPRTSSFASFPKFSMCSGDFVEIYGPRKNDKFVPPNVFLVEKIASGSGGGEVCPVDESIEKKNRVEMDTEVSEEINKDGVNVNVVDGGNWDGIVTCFFMDTAPVVLE